MAINAPYQCSITHFTSLTPSHTLSPSPRPSPPRPRLTHCRDPKHYQAMVYARAIINAKIWAAQA